MEEFIMNDEKKMNELRTLFRDIKWIPMIIMIFIEMFAVGRVLLCILILLLITIELVFSGILKDSKGVAAGSAWYALWLIILIVNLFKI